MYRITWDTKTGGVLLNQKVVEGALGVSPRPVFHEELDMLKLDEMGWKYPHCKEPIMWAVNKQYYYRGEMCFEVKGANIYDAPVVVVRDGVEPKELQAVDMKKMLEKNQDIMFLIESEAIEFIRDTYLTYSKAKKAEDSDIDYEALALRAEKRTKKKMAIVKEDCESFDVMPLEAAQEQGKKIYHTTHVDKFIASFSGGKDSQVVLDLCNRTIPPTEFQVIYSDTGYELPSSLELYEQVKEYYHKLSPSLKFSLTKNHESVLNYWDKIGTPSDTHRWCCSVMKTAPLYRSLKIEGTNKQAKVLAFDGVRAEESVRRSGYQRIGKGKHTTIYNAHPILHWNSVEIFLYLFRYGLTINKSYRQGKARVGCLICPFSTGWDEMISNKFYYKEIFPFVDRLKKWSKLNKINDIDRYLKERNWKIKAIGEPSLSKANVVFPYNTTDFVADISNSNHPIFSWLYAVGEYSQTKTDKETTGEIKFNGILYPYKINSKRGNDQIRFIVYNCINTKLIYLLRRLVNKSAYCIQCEVCEVDCPTGALTVYPQLNIDKSKCIHCHRCLTTHDMGCIAADNIRMIRDMDKKSTAKVHAYKKFGMHAEWIDEFLTNHVDFWSNNTLGSAQVDGFKSWLKDAEVIDSKNQLTEFGEILSVVYRKNSITAWELLLVNLVINSYIVNWFVKTIPVGCIYDRNILNEKISTNTGASKITYQNAITALLQLFSYSPIGSEIGFAIDINNKQKIRKEYEKISDVSVAYCLYKTTEKSGIRSLRINDFYSKEGIIGPNTIFGISKPTFIKALRQLTVQKERVLIAELNMGLDNISLRNDLTALDVIKALTI